MFIQYCLNNAKLWKIFFIRENIAISDLDKLNAKGGYDTEMGREFNGVEF